MEPKAKMNSLAPFPSEGRASVSIFDGKNPVRTHSLPQPYLPHPPTEHGGPFHYRSSKAPVDPGHYTQVMGICICLSGFSFVLAVLVLFNIFLKKYMLHHKRSVWYLQYVHIV